MKTVHFNGEYWYENNLSLLERVKKWFLWQPNRKEGILETPISLFGHRITFQPFGVDVSLPTRYLCIHRDMPAGKVWRVYLSPNGTPWAATAWLYNPKTEVAIMAKNRERPDAEGAARGSYAQRSYPPSIN